MIACFRLVLLFFGLLMASPTLADNRYALIIGNGNYEIAGTLPNALNDAKLLENTLNALGFEVKLVLDADEEAMGEALDALERHVKSSDVVALYYAGHGLQKDGENYLVPIDAKLRSNSAIERETLRLQSFLDVMKDAPISLVFLDACRNNPLADALASSTGAKSRSVTRGLAVVRTTGDMLVTFATLPNTVASDGKGRNSPFAKALAKNLVTPDVEISVLMKRVTRDVMAETANVQRPQQLSQMQAELYLAKSGAVASKGSIPSGNEHKKQARTDLILSVYPPQVTTNEEISFFAVLPKTCEPVFLAISPSRKVTPIPNHFFKKEQTGHQLTRYEMSPGSRYGLIIQEQDERGHNWLGLLCAQHDVFSQKNARLTLLRTLHDRLEAGDTEGVINDVNKDAIAYSFSDILIK